MQKSLFFNGCAITLLTLATSVATAGTLNVPSGPFPTIQSAINAAVNDDVILVAPGTYNERLTISSKRVLIQSVGGPAVTTIDGGGGAASTPVIFITGVIGLPGAVLDGFTVTGGNGIGTVAGGIQTGFQTTVVINNCVIKDNKTATFGGGVLLDGRGTISNSIIEENTASLDGGGLWTSLNFGEQTIQNTVFRSNTAGRTGGGAVLSASTVRDVSVIDSQFYNNGAGNVTDTRGGGGVFVRIDGEPAFGVLIDRCDFRGNSASTQGGGVRVLFSDANTGTVGGRFLIRNSIIRGNLSGDIGAGVNVIVEATNSPTVMFAEVINCTVVGNRGSDFAGIYIAGVDQARVANVITWWNTSSLGFIDELVQLWTPGNTIEDVRNSAIQFANDYAAFPGVIDDNPQFIDVLGIDGLSWSGDENLRLSDSSPCIDTGDAGVNVGSSDFDGGPRVLAFGVDMGAYESAPISVCAGDLNGDGVVDFDDFSTVLANYGNVCP